MSPIRTLLVDDEYLALNLLEGFIRQLDDELLIVGKCQQPLKALEILTREPVDLLFLDVQMPQLKGTELLRALPSRPVTIFTTAYQEHAVEAFGLDAVDYLPKPFSFPRFVQAVNKARTVLRGRQLSAAPAGPDGQAAAGSVPGLATDAASFLTVKANGRYTRLPLDQILFIEAWQEYATIHLVGSQLVVTERLKNLEAALPPSRFLRVHKSYIVATDKVTALEGNELSVGQYRVPVGRATREQVLATIFGLGREGEGAG